MPIDTAPQQNGGGSPRMLWSGHLNRRPHQISMLSLCRAALFGLGMCLAPGVFAQTCFQGVCIGHTIADVARQQWNTSRYQEVTESSLAEYLRDDRYVGPEGVLKQLYAVSGNLDHHTVLLLQKLSGVCGVGSGLPLRRGDPTKTETDSLSVYVEPVPRDRGLRQIFEVVDIRAYLPAGTEGTKRQITELCRTLYPESSGSVDHLQRSCESGWARHESSDGSTLVSISAYDQSQIRVRLERIDVDYNDADLLSRLPACQQREKR